MFTSHKPVALFLGNRDAVDKAYHSETKKILADCLQIIDNGDRDCDFEQKKLSPEPFQKVEYIFSTWNMAKLSETEIDYYFPSLKAVFYAAGTVRYFAQPYLNKGIKIFSAWGANAVPVAEVTVAQIILASKGYFQTLHNGNGNKWYEHNAGAPYPGNYDTAVGIIGAGMIGKLVIGMLKNYRLKVKVYDPFLPAKKADELGVTQVSSVEELFETCQVISNHLANNPQTQNLINKSCFDKMGCNAVFINTGRGQQVNEADMIEALKECPTRVALLDVTYPEPPMADSELYTLKNVFLSPHLAGSLGNEIQRMGDYMKNEFLALYRGQPTSYEVTPDMLVTMA